MKIKITTDRKPWVNGAPQPAGAEVEATEADANALISANMAEAVEAQKARKVKE